ncbi:uncharacterized protein IL334_003315 [Kwoniella shivajii]|uniref:HhH-GPD domain-containing protein n=1 Tax=Kwoniella shivajii TaxID=564305 RepID=A0ABZ1CXI7_9TREE|nr:hypothetical protein IL334_003315 [Kwoniella shivajii]
MIRALQLLSQFEYEWSRYQQCGESSLSARYGISATSNSTLSSTASRRSSSSLVSESELESSCASTTTSASISKDQSEIGQQRKQAVQEGKREVQETNQEVEENKEKDLIRSPYFPKQSRFDPNHNTNNKMKTRSQTSPIQVISSRKAEDQVGVRLLTPPSTLNISTSKRTSWDGKQNKRGLEDIVNHDEVVNPLTPDSLPKRNKRIKKDVVVEIPLTTPSKVAKNNKEVQQKSGPGAKKKKKKEKGEEIKSKAKKGSRKGKDKNNTSGANLGEERKEEVNVVSENGVRESIGKIHLIQEKLRYNPWKLLIATSLLNKTSGRAAIPILEILLERYPTPKALAEASIPDLSILLYPLGLYNQRASSLVRFSNQYLDWSWPLYDDPSSLFKNNLSPLITTDLPPIPNLRTPIELPIPSETSSSPSVKMGGTKGKGKGKAKSDTEMDVEIFHGAGKYASDSFRIYSHLLKGRGAPEKESEWLRKGERAKSKMIDDGYKWNGGVEELKNWLSDDDEGVDAVVGEEEEWRKVRPLDKELRRYLIWRWGIEGIVYDIYTGPRIVKDRDRRRLSYLLKQQE